MSFGRKEGKFGGHQVVNLISRCFSFVLVEATAFHLPIYN